MFLEVSLINLHYSDLDIFFMHNKCFSRQVTFFRGAIKRSNDFIVLPKMVIWRMEKVTCLMKNVLRFCFNDLVSGINKRIFVTPKRPNSSK